MRPDGAKTILPTSPACQGKVGGSIGWAVVLDANYTREYNSERGVAADRYRVGDDV